MNFMAWNFVPGDRVIVTKTPNKYSNLDGKVGTVRSAYNGNITVILDGVKNRRSGIGVFYLAAWHLAPFDPDTFMNHTTDAPPYAEESDTQKEKEEIPMLKNYRVAGIRFQDGYNTDKTYPYALYDENIAIGDLVVVMTGHHGMSIAEVCSIGDFDKDAVSCDREIVCKVDMTAYQDRKARAKKLADLKKEMDAKVKALQEVALYELMAEKDPELKGMLEAFKALEQ